MVEIDRGRPDRMSSTETSVDSNESRPKRTKRSSSVDYSQGLSVQTDIRNGSTDTTDKEKNSINYIQLDGKKVELEVISSSSSDNSDNSDGEDSSAIEETAFTNATNDNNYENSDNSEDEDGDSDISELEFEQPTSPEDDIGLDLFNKEAVIPPLSEIRITKKVSSQVRKYLKTEGHGKFLDLFLPPGPTPDDIFTLVKLLGFQPPKIRGLRTLPSDVILRASITCLKNAINKVIRTRTRLPDFHEIKHVVDALSKAENIIILTGAGISTSLGIPDFRSSQGFYSKMRNLGLDDPQEVFSLDVFRRDPSIFYSIAYMILPPEDSSTPLHAFIKLLQDKGKLLRNYTQNIDNLEGNVGVLPEKLVQCHGSFATASCITCKYNIPGETLYPNLRSKKIAYCPFCESERKALLKKFEKHEDEGLGYSSRFQYVKSFGVMKPDITFFGENLPDRYHDTIKEDIEKCDLLITIGTSLKVAPVSEIVNRIPAHVPQILINRDPINHCEFDVEFLGYCDQAITWICGKTDLSWEIPHPKYKEILDSGLELEVIDQEYGRYRITDADERLKERLTKLEETKKLDIETQGAVRDE
ncbi:uncharacterized protein C5L36_0B01610 [Pichia kudriavzevii]|uniref:NAD-dependent histone deacetylase SIR2 n=1 Tax=Pichia kudriavzevii TaxID=4909 RepID=A0A1V2LKP0_PICKU|nr:uncharacterized protein C5L36_0B01610 [Pichia kudriavzevii]AWU74897.1 hypothetical protein C5L36_0B01610 [Pichia kudriavzevii]ONH73360.1 NAD-dependent histone deacetylase SIR2 [Pichia kudriavzevii]